MQGLGSGVVGGGGDALLVMNVSFLLSVKALVFDSYTSGSSPSPVLPAPRSASCVLGLGFSRGMRFGRVLGGGSVRSLARARATCFKRQVRQSYPRRLRFSESSLSVMGAGGVMRGCGLG